MGQSADLPIAVLTETVLTQVPPLPVDYNQWLPAKGRRLLAFSDSRGAAARLGPKLGFHLSTLHRAWIEAGLVARRCNEGTLSITDLLSADSLCTCTELHIVNFMIDVRRWLPITSPLAPLLFCC
jgi:hypothetical protein